MLEKSETTFNIWRNNHRKNAKSGISILGCKHFNETNRNFQYHAELILIKQIKKQTTERQENS